MQSFKQTLSKRYNNKCIVTRYSTPDGNHIIPQCVCDYLQLNHIKFNPDNGLLLTPSLHRDFDRYQWAFDVSRAIWQNSSAEWCFVPIVTSPTAKSLMCFSYDNQWVKIKVSSLPYLWINYQIFLTIQFEGLSQYKSFDVFRKYAEYFNTLEFRTMERYQNYHGWQKTFSSNNQGSPVIIKHSKFDDKFLVVYRNCAWNQPSWLVSNQLNQLLIKSYLDRYLLKKDPLWKPT